MDKSAIAHQRLWNLRITAPRLGSFDEVLRWLGAVQSQDYAGGKWGIGHRTAGITDAQLDHHFSEGKLLRTHVLRPTWHFVLPEDIRWMLELTAPRVLSTSTYWTQQFGVEGSLEEGQRIVAKALERGEHLTRKELQECLAESGVKAAGPGLGYILMFAELNAVICSGAMRGKQHTYALVEQRAPHAKRLSRDEALVELTRRYFTSHGPSTIADYRWWSSLLTADIRRGLDMLGKNVERITVDGTDYWHLPAESKAAPSPAVFLLQAYDEYFVGYTGASKAILDLSNAKRAALHRPASPAHVLVLDSQVVGRWQRALTKNGASVQTEIYVDVDDPTRAALEAAVEQYGTFLEVPASLG